jgi:hypothetical protein
VKLLFIDGAYMYKFWTEEYLEKTYFAFLSPIIKCMRLPLTTKSLIFRWHIPVVLREMDVFIQRYCDYNTEYNTEWLLNTWL